MSRFSRRVFNFLFSDLADVVEHVGRNCLLRIRRYADSAAPVVVAIEEEDILFSVAISNVFYALPSTIFPRIRSLRVDIRSFHGGEVL